MEEGNTTPAENLNNGEAETPDWLAEKIGFELAVAFRRTIALYWPTKCVFRLSAANRECQPENRADCTVQERQCKTKAYASPLRAGYSPGTDKRTDWMGRDF